MEDAARQALGAGQPWPSTWKEMPPLNGSADGLKDPAIFCLPVVSPASQVSACMTLFMERQTYQGYERIFEVACQELDRILALAESQRMLNLTIADQRKAEARIRAMAEELEQRVLERTAQLESTVKDLEDLTYSESHDLRAPLRGIDGFSRVLLEDYHDQLDESGRHYLSRIRLGAQRMGLLIDDLLRLATINRSPLILADLDLSGLCGQIVEDLVLGGPDRRVEVAIQQGARVRADRGLLRRALENLLGNAWKFTAQRADARIEVGEARSGTGERAFFIRDNGLGFDMAHAGRLFQPFQRLHAGDLFEGNGIGLAIVQQVIHRHGGKVWAQAEPGAGATFFFTLPEGAPGGLDSSRA
jgi:light-regulated signal transduction histidine kinase (bacteriophytochrome)